MVSRKQISLNRSGRSAGGGGVARAALVVAVVAGLALPGEAYPRPGRTLRVSLGDGGVAGDLYSVGTDMTPDGRYVAFTSASTNLVPGDTFGFDDVFVHDRQTGRTDRISVASDGSEADGSSHSPAISADGRYVAFVGQAWNLIPDDLNDAYDTFLHDRATGLTQRVSVSSEEEEGDGSAAWTPAISADGRFVAFHSAASNMVPGDTNGAPDIFVRDVVQGTTERVSVSSGEVEGNGGVGPLFAMTPDGRHVAFDSGASNLVPGDTNGWNDVFVRDRTSGATERISVSTEGLQGNAAASDGAISPDGRYVAFSGTAPNLVPADANTWADVFLRDRVAGTTERVSVTSAGVEVNRWSTPVAVGAGGRYVLFYSEASNLVPGDTNGRPDVFVRDVSAGTTERISVGDGGAQGDAVSTGGALALDGRLALFSSAPDLTAEDTNGAGDAFIRDRGPAIGVGGMAASVAGETVTASGWATFSSAPRWEATDATGDSGAGGHNLGADLTAARVVYRPEQEDLLVTLVVAGLPGLRGVGSVRGVAGAPGVLYALELRSGGVEYEVRVLRAGGTAVPPAAPVFAVYRCETTCTEVARTQGGIGTTASEVVVSVPLMALGAAEGASLTAVRAFTAVGEAATGGVRELDQTALPDIGIPSRSIVLGIAPRGTSEKEVRFETLAALAGGEFTAGLPGPGGGEHDVWARACLGSTCGSLRVPLS